MKHKKKTTAPHVHGPMVSYAVEYTRTQCRRILGEIDAEWCHTFYAETFPHLPKPIQF